MNSLLKTIVLGASMLATATTGQAALLGLPAKQAPDIYSQSITVTYDSSNGHFHAGGVATKLEYPTATISNITAASPYFDLSLDLDSTGHIDGAGTLTIGGTIGATYTSGTLLTAVIQPNQFGYVPAPGGDNFEFVFKITGGDLAAGVPQFAVGSLVGVRLDANFPAANPGATPNFSGVFNSNFDNIPNGQSFSYIGTADTYAVPEPATMALFAVGGLMIVGRKRK